MVQKRRPSEKPRPFNVYVINVKLQSDTKNTRAYAKLFELLYESNISHPIKGGKAISISALFKETIEETPVLYGKIARYTEIESNKWFNRENKEIQDFEIGQSLNPNATETDFFFFPEIHRLCIRRDSEISLQNIENFLTGTLPKLINKNDKVVVSIEQSKDIFTQLTDAKEVKSLEIDITYTNDDFFDEEASDWIDEELKKSNSGEVQINFKPDQRESLEINKSSMIQAFLKIAKSNGNVKARVVDNNNKRRTIITKNHPAQHKILPQKDEAILATIKKTLFNLFRSKVL